MTPPKLFDPQLVVLWQDILWKALEHHLVANVWTVERNPNIDNFKKSKLEYFHTVKQDGDYACTRMLGYTLRQCNIQFLKSLPLSFLHSHCSTVNSIFHFSPACTRLVLTVLWFLSLSRDPSEPTDPRPADLRREEDDPNRPPNPSLRCRSAKLCTPTTLRTRTSSASTLTMWSTSSERVSAQRDSLSLSGGRGGSSTNQDVGGSIPSFPQAAFQSVLWQDAEPQIVYRTSV